MITLQGNIAGLRFREQRHAAEFALRYPLVEVVAAENIFDILDSIDVVLAFFGRDDDAHFVPLAGGLGCVNRLAGLWILGWFVEGVKPAAALRVLGGFVVFELDFRTGGPGSAAFVGDVI